MTEGTYPHNFGGVSVWCDQLVRGMPEHSFRVLAITASGAEPVVWELPGHVTAESVPMWGPPAGRPPSRGAARRFERLCRAFLHAILSPSGPEAEVFPHILRALFEYGQTDDLQGALRSEGPVRWLMDAWRARKAEYDKIGVRPTVHDALTAIDLLEHQLRPLMRPAPRGDVTHAVSNGIPVLPGLAAKWTYGTPLCLTEHGIYLRERYIGFQRSPYPWPVKSALLGFLRLLCGTGYRAADLVTPSNLYNQRWQVRCGADPGNLETVYNGVDPACFPAAGAEPAVPTISWAGRVDPIKDLETLIRAFALVKEEVPDVQLRMFGGTPSGGERYRDRCEKLASDLGVAEHATFEGRVDDIRDAYAAGTVVVLSSISEGFPYTLIEAMTCGRATVATDVGGVTEAVADTGLVVPPRDPRKMADACVRLLNDEMSRRRLGHAARDRALELFTVDRAVEAFRSIYDGLGELPAEPAPGSASTPCTASAASGAPVSDRRPAETRRLA
ncbi:GT4 family glycosyltransferase PelF [Actinomadura macra]|uniref:GT4 family glycosyltransferase PelF n=1 Tax=Actinomadura macra TaxID=46164 RepID=UPI00082DE87D|nr:GT4 family glycosyltransferase PelF [Actinomadura macra]